MSIAALNWAFAAEVTPSGAKFVLVALADHADADGHCYPGQEVLAAKTGQSARSVRAHLAALEEAGWIARTKRRKAGKQTSDAYNLVWARAEAQGPKTESPAPQAENPAARGAGQAENSSASPADVQAEKNVASGGKKRPPQAARFSAEPPENHKITKRAREAEPVDNSASARATDPETPPPERPVRPPPACAVWREGWPAIEGTCVAPLARYCVPDSDAHGVLTLAVATPGLGFAVLAWAAPELQRMLKREIAVVVRRWVPQALKGLGHERQGRHSNRGELHRRSDEVVSLQDPAWRIWEAARRDGALAERGRVMGNCLADDFDEAGGDGGAGGPILSVMCCEAMLLMGDDDHEAWLARVLGCRVKMRLGYWVGDAIEVRAKTEARGLDTASVAAHGRGEGKQGGAAA